MKFLKKAIVLTLKRLDLGSAAAVRLTKYTGKSKTCVHPKHFLNPTPWFMKFIEKSDTVLDLGCGYGQNSLKTAKKAKKVLGLDSDRNLLEQAKISADQNKISNVSFNYVNLESRIPIENKLFNKIIILDVLEHIKNRDQLAREIKRILKNDGLAIISVPNAQTSWKKFQRSAGVCSFSDPDHKIEFSERSIKKFLNNHKLKVIHFGYDTYDTPLRGLFDIIGAVSLGFYRMTIKWRNNMVQKSPKETSGFQIVVSK